VEENNEGRSRLLLIMMILAKIEHSNGTQNYFVVTSWLWWEEFSVFH